MLKKIFQSIVIISILVILLCIGCSKTTEVLIDPSWKLLDSIYFYWNDKIILNGSSFLQEFYITTYSRFLIFDHTSTMPVFSRLESNTHNMNNKPIINDSLSAFSNEYNNGIVFKRNVREQPTPEYIYISNIDTIFTDNVELATTYYKEPIGAFSDNSNFLTIFKDTSTYDYYFMLINYTFENSTYSGIKIKNVYYNLIEDWSILTIKDIESFGNRFFVATHGMGDSKPNFIVDDSGNYTEIDIRYYGIEFFEYNDKIYLLISDDKLYSSDDLGESWEDIGTINPSHLSPRFFQVSGKLCLYIQHQIWEFDIDEGEFSELDNWGLEGNEITSVDEFNGNVYVSTLSGLFYRDVNEFFTYKEEENTKLNLTFIR